MIKEGDRKKYFLSLSVYDKNDFFVKSEARTKRSQVFEGQKNLRSYQVVVESVKKYFPISKMSNGSQVFNTSFLDVLAKKASFNKDEIDAVLEMIKDEELFLKYRDYWETSETFSFLQYSCLRKPLTEYPAEDFDVQASAPIVWYILYKLLDEGEFAQVHFDKVCERIIKCKKGKESSSDPSGYLCLEACRFFEKAHKKGFVNASVYSFLMKDLSEHYRVCVYDKFRNDSYRICLSTHEGIKYVYEFLEEVWDDYLGKLSLDMHYFSFFSIPSMSSAYTENNRWHLEFMGRMKKKGNISLKCYVGIMKPYEEDAFYVKVHYYGKGDYKDLKTSEALIYRIEDKDEVLKALGLELCESEEN